MINSIIFDFGDVFIDLEKEAQATAFAKLGLYQPTPELLALNEQFEKGRITETFFIETAQKHIPKGSYDEIKTAWNSLIGDFPLYRLEFLQMLSNKYNLYLLSNTDSIHIQQFEHLAGPSFSNDFYNCFKKVYFSYEMGMRKPEPENFKEVMRIHDLAPKRTLFVDDKKENTDIAKELGIHVWNLKVGEEDVVKLFEQKHLPL